MDKNNLIIHIPHSSLEYPSFFEERLTIDRKKFNYENIFTSDYLVDRFIPNNFGNIVKFEYSRLFCDVEKFKDDKLEEMSKVGMGVIYEKVSSGDNFIRLDNDYKKLVIEKYYDKYHKQLDDLTTDILKNNDKCFILDLHSFSDEFVKLVLNLENNPDICIGFNDTFRDDELISETIEHFKGYGYSVELNYPYSGSLVPNKYFNIDDDRIKSLMIEVNKRIYLKNNMVFDNQKGLKLKECMDDYYNNVLSRFL